MKIYLASDHAGFNLKEHIRKYLEQLEYHVTDLGTDSEERANWVEYGARGAVKVSEDPEYSRAIIICGSGIGMSIVCNKFRHVRAALCNEKYAAEMARMHNNANVLNMGARVLTEKQAEEIVDIWLNTPFEGGRHAERLDYLSGVEDKNFK